MRNLSRRYDHKRHTPLGIEEERDIVRLTLSGDLNARNTLINANVKFVISVARKYMNRGVELEDLISSGILGMITASERFDPTQSGRFMSYAVWWVRQAIIKTIDAQGSQIKTPPLSSFRRNISNALQAGAKGRTEEAEKMLMEIRKLKSSSSLDSLQDSGFDYHDTTQAPDEVINRKNTMEKLVELIKILPDKEAIIIQKFFGFDGSENETLESVGHSVGMTKEGVRQRREKALVKLRREAAKHHLEFTF